MKTVKISLLWVACIAVSALIFSCKKSDSPAQATKPTLSTTAITNITANTATSGGFIGDSSSLYVITARGVVYSSGGDPTGSVITAETADLNNTPNKWGNYPSSLTGLTANTTYYIRAFVGYKDMPGTSHPPVYGELRTFKTLP